MLDLLYSLCPTSLTKSLCGAPDRKRMLPFVRKPPRSQPGPTPRVNAHSRTPTWSVTTVLERELPTQHFDTVRGVRLACVTSHKYVLCLYLYLCICFCATFWTLTYSRLLQPLPVGDEVYANAMMCSGEAASGIPRPHRSRDRSAEAMTARLRGTGSAQDMRSLLTKYRSHKADATGRTAVAILMAGSVGAWRAAVLV